MPELPEVESIVRTLSRTSCMRGPILVDFKHSNYKLRLPYPTEDEINNILGIQLLRVYRRAKYLILIWGEEIAKPNQEWAMIIHLGMTGSLVFYKANQGHIIESALNMMATGQSVEYLGKNSQPYQQAIILSHPHFCCRFYDGSSLIYFDPRRFGMIKLLKAEHLQAWEIERQLGVEALDNDFTGEYLHHQLRKTKNSPIKKLIMNQKLVVGIGNIYANEALFKAKISPTRIAMTMNLQEAENLVDVSKEIMQLAIEKGGSTIRDYRNNDNQPGGFQENFAVYGRVGKLCINCENIIEKCAIEGRATYWCRKCQK